MTTPAEYGQLALYVYNVVTTPQGEINRPSLPSPTWEELDYQPDNSYGFSYGVFRNTGRSQAPSATPIY